MEEKIDRTCSTCYYNDGGYCTVKGERTNKENCGWHCTEEEFEKLGEKEE